MDLVAGETGKAGRRGASERRLLPRADLGRRDEDLADSGILGAGEPTQRRASPRPLVHLFVLVAVFIGALVLVAAGNARLAPLLFNPTAVKSVASVLATGNNYATFDLNIESRTLRGAHIASLTETPELAILGASHWQEGHVDLLPHVRAYNSHVHRDYYEDMLGVTEMFVRNNRLPEHMIITIRDNLFTPVADRTDFLWVPGIPDYRDMADRLGLPQRPLTELIPVPQIREAISLVNLRANLRRWRGAKELPHVTGASKHDTLDILLSDGSIHWSREHDALFTAEFARERALAFAAQRRNDPPKVDPAGIVALERLFEFLNERGVRVFLAHPPFNPIYYDALQGSTYMEGLGRIEALTQDFADRFGFEVIGSFNPHDLGCRADMYIDAEHSSPECLGKILNQYSDLVTARRP